MPDSTGTFGAGRDAIVRVLPAPRVSTPITEEPTMLIRITRKCRVSLDGTHVLPLDEGATTDVSVAIAESLVEQGKAEYVGEPEPAPAPPAAPVPPEDNTVAGAAAQGTEVPGGDVPALPPANGSRADHDAVARQLGIDPAQFATRDDVRAGIVAELERRAAATA